MAHPPAAERTNNSIKVTSAARQLSTHSEQGLNSLLASKLGALRRRHVGVAVVTGLAMILVVSLELLAVMMFLDWWLELPWSVQLLSLVAQAGVFTYLLLVLVVAPLIRQPDEEELALMVERAKPEFRSRLIAAVQLVRPGALAPNTSQSLISALVEETESLAKNSDFRQIVATDSLKLFGMMALAIPLLALAGILVGGETSGVLLRRVLLSTEAVPRKTRIVVQDGNLVVGIGDTVQLEASVQGIIPGHGRVEIKYRSRRTQEFALEQNRDRRDNYRRTIENVQDSFTYRFFLGDGVSQVFEVKAIPRPTVASIECEQEFPAYTGLKNVTRSLGDLTLLAGSTLKLKMAATKELQLGAIKLIGVESNVALSLDAGNRRDLAGQFVVPAMGLKGFQAHMLDLEGMESRDNAVYRIDVLPDKPPVIRITYPDRKEELVTRNATMLVGFDATDDFQIAKVRLKYKTESVDGGAEKAVELKLEDQSSTKIRRRYEWKFSEVLLGVGEGSVIEYWLEAEDNNDFTGPGVGRTEHQLARIVSESEKRADLLNRAGDYLGSISDVVADQEKLNQNLGVIIRAKAGLR